MVDVAEGPIDMEKTMTDFARQARTMCDQRGGYFGYQIAENQIRIEIDPSTGLVLGRGDLALDFQQKCPGMPLAKLIKGEGTFWAHIDLQGFVGVDNTINGTFNLEFYLPTLVSFESSFSGLSWGAEKRGSRLEGALELSISRFDIYGKISFALPVKRGEAQFITGLDRETLELKEKIAQAKSKVARFKMGWERDWDTGVEGVGRLESLRYNAYSLKDISAAMQLLFDIFDGFELCMNKMAEMHSIVGPVPYRCLCGMGNSLNDAENLVRKVELKSVASLLYTQISAMWDRVRYWAAYAPKEVEFDKVECCQRAKKAINKALYNDPNNASAKRFKEELEGHAGCQGMPLFGINREEIERKRKEELARIQAELFTKQKEIEEKRKQAEAMLKVSQKQLDDLQNKSDDLAQSTEEGKSQIASSVYNSALDIISKTLPPDKAEAVIEVIEETKVGKSDEEAAKAALAAAKTAIAMAKMSVKKFTDYFSNKKNLSKYFNWQITGEPGEPLPEKDETKAQKTAYLFIDPDASDYQMSWIGKEMGDVEKYYKSLGYKVIWTQSTASEFEKAFTDPNIDAGGFFGHRSSPGIGDYDAKTLSSLIYNAKYKKYRNAGMDKDAAKAKADAETANFGLSYFHNHSCHSADNNSMMDLLVKKGGTYWGEEGKLWGWQRPDKYIR